MSLRRPTASIGILYAVPNEYVVSFRTLNHFLGPRLARRELSRLAGTRPGGVLSHTYLPVTYKTEAQTCH